MNQHAARRYCDFLKHKHSESKESIEEHQRHLPDSSDGCLERGDHIFHKEVATVASFFCYGFSCSCIYKSGPKKACMNIWPHNI